MLKQYLSKRNSEVRDDVIVTKKGVKGLSQLPECPSDNGLIQYLNSNVYAYKVDKIKKTWQVCTGLNY